MHAPLTLTLENGETVSALLNAPADARACYVFAHSAGAGMTHPSMNKIADGLAERGIATLRYQFLYMEKKSKRPDAPKLAHMAVRAAVTEAGKLGLPLIAGGRSFGGRMTSQAQALAPLPGVVGLAFFGFPLHPAGKPGDERAKHLDDVKLPMLFIQGDRDELATLEFLNPVIAHLGKRVSLKLFEHADHSLHVPARSGRKDADVLAEALDAMRRWVDARF